MSDNVDECNNCIHGYNFRDDCELDEMGKKMNKENCREHQADKERIKKTNCVCNIKTKDSPVTINLGFSYKKNKIYSNALFEKLNKEIWKAIGRCAKTVKIKEIKDRDEDEN